MTANVLTGKLILGACIAPNHSGQGHQRRSLTGEFVQIRRQGAMLGMRLQQLVHHLDGTKSWSDFYVFKVEPSAAAVDIRIMGGHGIDHLDGLSWIAFNNSSRPELNNTGEQLRLVDRAGQILEERIFAADSCDVMPPVVKLAPVVQPAPHYSPWQKV